MPQIKENPGKNAKRKLWRERKNKHSKKKRRTVEEVKRGEQGMIG